DLRDEHGGGGEYAAADGEAGSNAYRTRRAGWSGRYLLPARERHRAAGERYPQLSRRATAYHPGRPKRLAQRLLWLLYQRSGAGGLYVLSAATAEQGLGQRDDLLRRHSATGEGYPGPDADYGEYLAERGALGHHEHLHHRPRRLAADACSTPAQHLL